MFCQAFKSTRHVPAVSRYSGIDAAAIINFHLDYSARNVSTVLKHNHQLLKIFADIINIFWINLLWKCSVKHL